MLQQAVMLDARRTVAEVAQVVEGLPDNVWVVVRRVFGWETFWYSYPAARLRQQLAGRQSDEVLERALDLHEYRQSPTRQATTTRETGDGATGTVMLDGAAVLGVVGSPVIMKNGGSGDRGGDDPVDVAPDRPGLPPDRALETSVALRDRKDFRAYPKLDAPEIVEPGQEFDLKVSFTRQKARAQQGDAVVVADAPPDFTLNAQVIAPGFEVIGALQQDIQVKRDDLKTVRAKFRLRATDPGAQPARQVITVQFSRDGQPLARAWRDVLVTNAHGQVGAVLGPAVAGSVATPVQTPAGPTADLTIYVEPGDGGKAGELIWRVVSPYPLTTVPAQELTSTLQVDDGKVFASDVIGQMSKSEGKFIQNHLIGVGRRVRSVMPVGVLKALLEVWQAVRATPGTRKPGVPSILLVSAELYVPWEIAALDQDIPATLLDASRPPFLGAQCRVGRWIPPGRPTLLGGAVPALPPEPAHQVGRRVVVYGNYGVASRMRELKQAVEESKALKKRWKDQAVAANASPDNVKHLLDGDLQDGELEKVTPSLLHFACHASFDDQHPAWNGLILEDGLTRVNPFMIEGSNLGPGQPFVFLNACQAALPQQELSDAGGFARAFLNKGCVGFVAPLWSVNDGVAHDFALAFYTLLEGGMPVSEALRELRQPFVKDTPTPSSTLMAYTYYGHPDLVLNFKN